MKHFIFTTRQHVMEDVSLKVSESEAEKIFDNDLAEELLLGKLDDSSIEAVENIDYDKKLQKRGASPRF